MRNGRASFQCLDLCHITAPIQLGNAVKLCAQEKEEIGLANT